MVDLPRRRIVFRKGYYRIQVESLDGLGWFFHRDGGVSGRVYQTSVLKAAKVKLKELEAEDDLNLGEWETVDR